MPQTRKLSRRDFREIEMLLKSEIERNERMGNENASQPLTDALDRLRDGSYGQCIYCGNQIAAERLMVIPETTNCLRCWNAA